MSFKDLKALLETLREPGANAWTVLCGIFGIAIIAASPSYLRTWLTYRNKKREIEGNLDRKLKKLDHMLAQKLAKAQKTASVSVPKPAAAKRSAGSAGGKKP